MCKFITAVARAMVSQLVQVVTFGIEARSLAMEMRVLPLPLTRLQPSQIQQCRPVRNLMLTYSRLLSNVEAGVAYLLTGNNIVVSPGCFNTLDIGAVLEINEDIQTVLMAKTFYQV
jgi:hypothetical protein